MDEQICVWVLEFLLRQPAVDDRIIELAIANLPLPPESSVPLSLKKSLALRTVSSAIADASISETLLEHLEILEAIDAEIGDPVSRSLQEAYCAVALECTFRYLHAGPVGKARYSAAVQRLWGERFRVLVGKSRLITSELLHWRASLDAALSEEAVLENLMRINTRADALRLCVACVDEAYAKFGPSFLEVVAVETARRADPAPSPSRDSPEENREAPEVRVSPKDAAGPNAGTSCDPDQSVAADDQNDRLKSDVPHKPEKARYHRRTGGGIKITDTEEARGGSLCGSYDSLPSPLRNKPQEALRSGSLALQGELQDPLPDAMQVAASLVAGTADTAPYLKPLPHHQVREESHAPDPSLDEGVTGAAPLVLGDCQGQPSGNQNVLTRCSLMDRNKSAQTYEWDDLSEGRSDRKVQPQNHSPEVLDVSPLKIMAPRRVSNRRQRKMWTLQEEETLRNGVTRFGEGHWKLILNNYRDSFRERTEVDLKDKWRNMTR